MNTKDVVLDPDKIPWEWANPENIPDIAWMSGPPDLLSTIFSGQLSLMDKYYNIEDANGCVVIPDEMMGEIDDRKVQMRIKDLGFRTIEELTEATNCLKNKPWKNTFVATDREHFYEELADALHFFVELCLTAGLSAEDLFTLYFKKHAVNEFRQESNY